MNGIETNNERENIVSDFVDNHEDELSELFNERSSSGGDSDALATFLAHLDNIGVDDMDEAEDAILAFDDKYRGTAGSEADFAEELAEEMGDLIAIPDYITSCIDWQDVWESGLRFDVESYELPSGGYGFVWVH